MLGWEVTKPLHEVADGDGVQGTFRGHRHEVKIDIRASRAATEEAHLSAGSLVRVEIESSRPGHAVRARITRQRDHLLATADWNGAQVVRRAGQLEEFSETPFVAEALERPGMDRIFERSLLRAVHFSGG